MTRSRNSRLVLVAACAVLAWLVPVLATAQDQPQKADITIALSTTARNGTSFTGVSGGGSAKVGEVETHYLYTTATGDRRGGGSHPPEAITGGSGVRAAVVRGGVSGGVSGVTTTTVSSMPPLEYDYLWQVDVKPVSIAIDTVTFDLDWKRTDVKDGARTVAAGDHRNITLRQGEKHLLDMIPCLPDARCANVFLDVQAAPLEESAVAQLAFTYDLWLVHETADGAKTTRHALVSGRQGEKLRFNFASVPLPLEATAAPGADSPYRLHISGTIVGRQKPDGTIELAVQPTRRQGFTDGSFGFEEGSKTFVGKLDETTSIALPVGSGRSSWRAGPAFKLANPRPGVSVEGDNVRIDLKPFFEGSTTSILVTPRREK